jgi:hypothetical protein
MRREERPVTRADLSGPSPQFQTIRKASLRSPPEPHLQCELHQEAQGHAYEYQNEPTARRCREAWEPERERLDHPDESHGDDEPYNAKHASSLPRTGFETRAPPRIELHR